MKLNQIFQKIRHLPFLAEILSAIGSVLYFLQSWRFAHIQTSMVDEGGYLLIGRLNAQGLQPFFQNYSFPAWYAPLSYYIPGQIEALFGPGLRTGRYFSIFLSFLTLFALWLTARRLGNRWWAAAIIWAFVLSPVAIQMNSIAGPQLLVACFTAWSLYFVLGEKRRFWQVFVGSLLAGLAVMTRHNIVPSVVFLAVYVFWQHGWKKGLWSLLGGFLPIVIIHVIYWPNSLQLWATWLPASLTPFLDVYRYPIAGFSFQMDYRFSTLFYAFMQGFRFQFFPMVGCVVALFLWPRKGEWKSESARRMSWFLLVTFVILNLMHLWAAFSSSIYARGCVFCYATYIPYYAIAALLLVVVSSPSWRRKISKAGLTLRVLLIALFFTGMGYANFEGFGDWLTSKFYRGMARGINLLIWLRDRTSISIPVEKINLASAPARAFISALAGLVIGTFFIIMMTILYMRALKNSKAEKSLGYMLMIGLLLSGFVLSPLMRAEYREDGTCQQDMLVIYEEIGAELAEIIPEGSDVYWDVPNAVPLLYLPLINVHLTQIYNNFSYRLGGNTEEIHQKGFWNEALAKQWAEEADYLVYQIDNNQTYDLTHPADESKFDELKTSPINPCDPGSYLKVYRRRSVD